MVAAISLATFAGASGVTNGIWANVAQGAEEAESQEKVPKPGKPGHENLSLRGRVVFLADALKRRYGIETDADAARQQVALETDDGELYPLVKDARGRGFLLDERLRDIDMELLVRRHVGSPVVQVIRVYTVKEDGRYELDYWCDVCAIPMYELKQCECCQGPIRLRERRAADGGEPRKQRK